MKKMKRLLAVLTALALIFTLAGCGKTGMENASPEGQPEAGNGL